MNSLQTRPEYPRPFILVTALLTLAGCIPTAARFDSQNCCLGWPDAVVQQRAEQGDTHAQYQLAARYEFKKDMVHAEAWFRKAAELGQPDAQLNLGYYG